MCSVLSQCMTADFCAHMIIFVVNLFLILLVFLNLSDSINHYLFLWAKYVPYI